MGIDQPDSFLGGLWGDQHDHFQVMAIGDLLVVGDIIGVRQVGDDHSVYAGLYATGTEFLETVLHDRIQVAHQDDRDLYFAPDLSQLPE